MGKMDIFAVKATAKKIARRKLFAKIAAVVAAISITILLAFYGSVSFASGLGGFSVSLVEDSHVDKKISLSYTKDFSDPRTVLVCDKLEQMDNITEAWLPEDINDIDGNHNGKNHIAITFYLKNAGNAAIDYKKEILISGVKQGADEAIRVKLYTNDEAIVYAKPKKGTTVPEDNTQAFYSMGKVMSETRTNFKPEEIDKFTIVVWLEGNDPECIDNIKSGNVKMEMKFEII